MLRLRARLSANAANLAESDAPALNALKWRAAIMFFELNDLLGIGATKPVQSDAFHKGVFARSPEPPSSFWA